MWCDVVGFVKVVPTECTSAEFPTGPLTLLNKGPIVRQICRRIIRRLSSIMMTASSRQVVSTISSFKKGTIVADIGRGDNASHYFRTCALRKGRFSIIVGVRKSRPFVRPGRVGSVGSYFRSPRARVTALIGPFAPRGK